MPKVSNAAKLAEVQGKAVDVPAEDFLWLLKISL